MFCNENDAARHHQDILSEQEAGRIFFQIDKQKLLWYTICDYKVEFQASLFERM